MEAASRSIKPEGLGEATPPAQQFRAWLSRDAYKELGSSGATEHDVAQWLSSPGPLQLLPGIYRPLTMNQALAAAPVDTV